MSTAATVEDETRHVIGSIWSSRTIVDDFQTLCTFEGRFAGSSGEAKAVDFLRNRLAELGIGEITDETIPYLGWNRGPASITLRDGSRFTVNALGRSASTGPDGLKAPIIDLGRGTPADFTANAGKIPGRIVLVRHEYMQASGHIHRRRKFELAKAHGAAGFLIACNIPGGLLVSGSAGSGSPTDIPCAGVTHEAGLALASTEGDAVLSIEGEFFNRTACQLFLDIPGRTSEFIVLSAHIDGHHLAQSAIDNASGLSCALAVASAVKDCISQHRRGLRIALFNIEEWAVIGSREHLARLTPEQKRAFAFNINLDSVAGSSNFAVMTSAIDQGEAIVKHVNDAFGFGLRIHRTFMGNSDHGNYILNGIPAIRLLAGMDEPESNARFLLTPGDTADKVKPTELKT
ncbi:MAG: M28 family peptidase, partial [Xanthobacteraceae bacterium]